MSDERNYPVEPMAAAVLARRRDHAQRNPFGNTAEMVGHIDWQDARIAALEALLAEANPIIKELYEGLDYWTFDKNTVYADDLKAAKEWLAKAALGASSGAGSVGNE